MPRPTRSSPAKSGKKRAVRPENNERVSGPLAQERASQTRGLLILALAAILIAILRAGLHNAFPAHWWRSW